LNAAGRTGRILRGRRSHQSQALKKEDGPLGRSSPNKLAAFSLAVLHVNISAGVFQTAILEHTVDINAVIQNHMLVFKRLVLEAIHFDPFE